MTRQYVVPKHLRRAVVSCTQQQFCRPCWHRQDSLNFTSTFLQVKPVNHASEKPPLLSLATENYLSGDMLQMDLVGCLPDSGGFTHILTAKNTFTKYLFAIPLRNANAPNVAKQLFHMFMRTLYISKIIVSDMGTAFTAMIMQELCKVLEIDLKFATVEHPQTVASIELTHASLNQ